MAVRRFEHPGLDEFFQSLLEANLIGGGNSPAKLVERDPAGVFLAANVQDRFQHFPANDRTINARIDIVHGQDVAIGGRLAQLEQRHVIRLTNLDFEAGRESLLIVNYYIQPEGLNLRRVTREILGHEVAESVTKTEFCTLA